MSTNHTTLGELAFIRYCEAKRGKTYDDKPIPQWTDLPQDIKSAWEAAAEAVEDEVKNRIIRDQDPVYD